MQIFFIIPLILFLSFFIFIIYFFYKAVQKGNSYKNEPRISAPAKLVEKRNYVSNSFTYYYGTFEFGTGDRIELRIPAERVGLIIEGDEGELTFQGDMFIDFGQEIY